MSEEIKKSIFVKAIKKHYPIFCINQTRSILDAVQYAYEAATMPLYDPVINHEIIREIDIPMPLLNKGDEFYFEDTKQSVPIIKVIRTSDGNVVYVVETEVIDDEKAKKKYEEDRDEFFARERYAKDKIKRLENRTLLERIINKKID